MSSYQGKGLQQITGYGSGGVTTPYDPLFGQTITLGSMNNQSMIGQIDAFSLYETGLHPEVKQYQVYESPEDILALSVRWKKLRDEGKSPAGNLLHKSLFPYVTNEDRLEADQIRDYYSKKLMLLMLKDSKDVTKFRKDLSSFIHNGKMIVQENHLGIAYYLPAFYRYDSQLDKIKEQVNVNQEWSKERVKEFDVTKKLTPLSKILKENKKIKIFEYWFKDKDENAVMITLDPDNPLLHMFDYLFYKFDFVEIFGTFFSSKIDNLNHYKIANMKIVQT